MQKQKENLFSEKFNLLNSQENSEEINWTCSDSSEYENVASKDRLSNATSKPVKRKRKRKNKVFKNISNLDVSIVDAAKDVKEGISIVKSPILITKGDSRVVKESPTYALTATDFQSSKTIKREHVSPILTCKASQQQLNRNIPEKSPILLLKNSCKKVSPNVRKKLFKVEKSEQNIDDSLVCTGYKNNQTLDRRKSEAVLTPENSEVTDVNQNKDIKVTINLSIEKLFSTRKLNIDEDIKIKDINQENNSTEELIIPKQETLEIPTENSSDDSFTMLKTSNTELVKRVKTYFESNFSSENPSQHSIDSFTPKENSKTSDDIEILSFVTQVNSNRPSLNSEQEVASKNPSPLSSQSAEFNERTKKIKYKKNGLANRLSTLLKKQNASISLWQHERFLAGNSNFIIPKEEHLSLRLKNVNFKYGAYLLEAVDVDSNRFLILINAIYVQNINFSIDTVLKIYEPFKIVDFDDECKLIINVCKMETATFN